MHEKGKQSNFISRRAHRGHRVFLRFYFCHELETLEFVAISRPDFVYFSQNQAGKKRVTQRTLRTRTKWA